MTRTMREALQAMIAALEAGAVPQADPDDFPCFSEEALANSVGIRPVDLGVVLQGLTTDDIPTLQEAICAYDSDACAWLGFKIVTDPDAAVDSEDTEVVGIKGKGEGSADALPGIFVAYEDKRIVCARPYSERDRFQMLDITRGPHMHNEQYVGVAWLSVPLRRSGRVFMFGAGEVPLWTARTAHDVGFDVTVLDCDDAYLNEERFPHARRVLLADFGHLEERGLGITEQDYVLVLTRGHMHDPEALVFGIRTGAHYVGMMGCATKNRRVFELAEKSGVTWEQLEATSSPIGLKFGAKTPPELALCIVAELIQDRHARRMSA